MFNSNSLSYFYGSSAASNASNALGMPPSGLGGANSRLAPLQHQELAYLTRNKLVNRRMAIRKHFLRSIHGGGGVGGGGGGAGGDVLGAILSARDPSVGDSGAHQFASNSSRDFVVEFALTNPNRVGVTSKAAAAGGRYSFDNSFITDYHHQNTMLTNDSSVPATSADILPIYQRDPSNVSNHNNTTNNSFQHKDAVVEEDEGDEDDDDDDGDDDDEEEVDLDKTRDTTTASTEKQLQLLEADKSKDSLRPKMSKKALTSIELNRRNHPAPPNTSAFDNQTSDPNNNNNTNNTNENLGLGTATTNVKGAGVGVGVGGSGGGLPKANMMPAPIIVVERVQMRNQQQQQRRSQSKDSLPLPDGALNELSPFSYHVPRQPQNQRQAPVFTIGRRTFVEKEGGGRTAWQKVRLDISSTNTVYVFSKLMVFCY